MPRVKKETVEVEVKKSSNKKNATSKVDSAKLKKKVKTIVEAEVIGQEKNKHVAKEEKTQQKAFFFPRLIAYITDIMIITAVLSGILIFIPRSKNYETYLNEYQQIQTDFMAEKITVEQYLNRSIEVVHDIDYSNVLSMIIEVVIIILYFVVFQCYNKGQTLGKKLMHIQVVSANGEALTMNHYIFRSLIVNSLATKMLIIGMVLFMNKQVYYYTSFGLQGVQTVLIIISAFMVMYKKDGRGLQDLVANTKVIMCDEV